MEIKLHANATTTPRVRRYLQQSDKSDRELAKELGISVTTVRRWRKREQTGDKKTTPNVIHKAMRSEQVKLVNVLRDTLNAPLDELLFMVNEGLGITVSRATLNRYLAPAHQRQKMALQGKRALKTGVVPDTLTLHYRLLSMVMDDDGEHHLLWAREPVSGWCHARVFSGISLPLVTNWLNEVLRQCPADIQCLETENIKWFQMTIPGVVLRCETSSHPPAVVFSEALKSLVPAAMDPDTLVQHLCELWNTGKAQKKLGECTPQDFLETLRR